MEELGLEEVISEGLSVWLCRRNIGRRRRWGVVDCSGT